MSLRKCVKVNCKSVTPVCTWIYINPVLNGLKFCMCASRVRFQPSPHSQHIQSLDVKAKKRDRRHVPSCCFFLEKHIISTKAFLSISTQQCIIKSQKTYQDDNKRDAFTLYSASQNYLYFWHWW